MDWERASPSRSEAVAGDKKNKCNIKSTVNDLKSTTSTTQSSPNPNSSPSHTNTSSSPTTTTTTHTSTCNNTNNKSNTTATTTTTTGQLVGSMSRKNKPIPPPLDLSIGAANLSLHHQNLSSNTSSLSSVNNHHPHHHLHHLNNHLISSNQHHHHHNISSHSTSSGSPSQLHPAWYPPHHQSSHTPYLGSPKYNQPEKSLPLRKRWHSWSPILMNGQDESLLPLYSDSHLPSPIAGSGVLKVESQQQQQQQQQQSEMNLTESSEGGHHHHGSHVSNSHNNPILAHSMSLHHHPYPYSVSASSSPSPSSAPVPTTSGSHNNSTTTTNNNNNSSSNYRLPSYGHVLSHSLSSHGHGHHSMVNGHSNPLGLGLSIQTPSSFFTPNEPSPKFMNSPVFSYSTPDTSLYQGPFSPMRSSLYPPPSSPFTNLSLNTPGGPMSTGSGSGSNSSSSGGGPLSLSNSCYSNMIPSTLLSPAPSQASTNSLSYEDLHEKSSASSTTSGVGLGGGGGGGGGGGISLNFCNPVWSIFMPGTRVRFCQNAINSMDWYTVDYLAQNENLLHFKGEYAPHGLEVRTLVVTSSSKERIQITFCPVGDPDHPSIEVDCEPSHPFMVDKKGWCSVKPDVFLESFGAHCPALECGDICLNSSASSSSSRLQSNLSVQLNIQPISQQQGCVGGNSNNSNNNNNNQLSQHLPGITSRNDGSGTTTGSPYSANITNNNNTTSSNNNTNASAIINHANAIISLSSNSPPILNLNASNLSHSLMTLSPIKMEPGISMDEKPIPISVLPQTQQSLHHQSHQQHMHHLHSQQQQQQQQHQQQHQQSQSHQGKKFAVPSPISLGSGNGPLPSPAKRIKECHGGQPEQKGRRPMNAFLLFAKDKRPELIQQFPGKDNRSISVLLGEAWANLEPPEKEKYSSSARARAEEQKRIHPDCWKRKRSQSTSS